MADTNNKPQDEIVSELSKLGENFGKMFQNLWDSEEVKSIQREMKAGLEQMNRNVNRATENLNRATDHLNKTVDANKVDEKVKKAGDTVKEAWQTAHGPQIVTEMRQGFVDSLRLLNQQVEKMATPKKAEEVKPEPPPAEPVKPSQDVIDPGEGI